MSLRNTTDWSAPAVQARQHRLWETSMPGIQSMLRTAEQRRQQIRQLWADLPAPRTCVLLTEQASRRISDAVCQPDGVVRLDGILEKIDFETGLGQLRIFWFGRNHDIRYRKGGQAISETIWLPRAAIHSSQPGIVSVWDDRDMQRTAANRAVRRGERRPPTSDRFWSTQPTYD